MFASRNHPRGVAHNNNKHTPKKTDIGELWSYLCNLPPSPLDRGHRVRAVAGKNTIAGYINLRNCKTCCCCAPTCLQRYFKKYRAML